MREKIKKKIFAVSDIHGCATHLKSALAEAGFEKDSDKHLLVVLGDLFDRGIENREVLSFLSGIRNKVLIRGNHEDILYASITSGRVTDHQTINGTDITICEFFPRYHGGGMLDIFESSGRKTAEMLIRHIQNMQDYFESENYIFVHGFLPEDADYSDFRYANRKKWAAARWIRWYKKYKHISIPDGKTLVVGHSSAYYGSLFDTSREQYDTSIFRGENLIAIDGSAISTGRINVLVVEDLITVPKTFDIQLDSEEYRRIEKDRTHVYLTLDKDTLADLIPGDKIKFSDTGSAKSLTFVINRLHMYESFAFAEDDYSPEELGFFDVSPGYLTKDMLNRYSEVEILEHGVISIEFKA
nr:metallophosphoesterase [Clostridia bacterium]